MIPPSQARARRGLVLFLSKFQSSDRTLGKCTFRPAVYARSYVRYVYRDRMTMTRAIVQAMILCRGHARTCFGGCSVSPVALASCRTTAPLKGRSSLTLAPLLPAPPNS